MEGPSFLGHILRGGRGWALGSYTKRVFGWQMPRSHANEQATGCGESTRDGPSAFESGKRVTGEQGAEPSHSTRDTSNHHTRPGFGGTWRALKGSRWHVAGSHTCALRPGGVPELGTALPSLKEPVVQALTSTPPKLQTPPVMFPCPRPWESCCETQPPGCWKTPRAPGLLPQLPLCWSPIPQHSPWQSLPGKLVALPCHSVTLFKHS